MAYRRQTVSSGLSESVYTRASAAALRMIAFLLKLPLGARSPWRPRARGRGAAPSSPGRSRHQRADAIDHTKRSAIGLDGALNKLAHASYGPLLLGIVAAGLIGFALYSIADARYRRV